MGGEEREGRRLRVAVCHPDLGLGGAERLIVDACVELAERGCQVDLFTAFHDRERCFDETRTDRWFAVKVRGGWFPRNVLGVAVALCAYIRCAILALHIALGGAGYDVALVDQVAAAVLPLKWFAPRTKVLFYCHFPDLLLSAERGSAWKRAYRYPLDALEEYATGRADKVVVNSEFTRGVFERTFRTLRGSRVDVLYPAVAIPPAPAPDFDRPGAPPTFLSINRFERKKNVSLAVVALKALHSRLLSALEGETAERAASRLPRLVVAGGYDARLPENVSYLQELKELARSLGVEGQVDFVPSFTDAQRSQLLAECAAVVYTPESEHFGIVPLEAMAAGRPVIACRSGGPLETVVHGQTGFTCEPDARSFAAAMATCLDPERRRAMGRAARAHVQARFSRTAFGDALYETVSRLAGG